MRYRSRHCFPVRDLVERRESWAARVVQGMREGVGDWTTRECRMESYCMEEGVRAVSSYDLMILP